MEAHLASLDADTVRLIQQLQLEDLAEVSNIGESAYRECPSLEASLDKNNPDVVAMYNQEAADRQLAESCSAIRRDDAALIEAMLQEDNQTIEYQYGALYDCQHPVESEVEDDFEPEANQEQFRNDKLIHQDDYDSENTPYHDVAGDWSGMASSQAAAVSYDNDSPPLPSQPSSVDPTSRDGPGGALQITDGPDDGIRHECISCGAHFQHSLGSVLEAPCGHHYCHGCLNRLVDAALKDDSLFPPRCCSQAIPLDGQPFLSAKQSLLCIEKQREMETVDRTYCHKVGCSKFIWVEGESSAESVLVCPACEARTCSLCKGADHKNEECPNDTHAQMVLALAKENKWQRCFKCRSVVELDIGCNHMSTYLLPFHCHAASTSGVYPGEL